MTTTVETVQKIYVAFFNRPADKLGEAFWVDQLTNKGMTEAQMAAGFAGSAEYKALYAGMDNLNIVATLYQNLFARPATLTEALFWANLITNKTFTVDNIALQLANSAQGTDGTAMANKIAASVGFTAALDTLPEAQGYSGMAANVQARAWLATVSSDAATLTAAVAGTDAAIVNAVNASNTAAGQTLTLTTGVDALVGGAGNDTFNAVPSVLGNGLSATLTALDSIDGGAGTNTLNVVDTTNALAISAATTVKNIQTANISSSGTLAGSVAGWTGLTKVVATEFGGNAGSAFTAAATTDVTLSDAAAAASTISVQGGNNVAVTANAASTAGSIGAGATVAAAKAAAGTVNVGTVVPVTGTVAVTVNESAVQTGSTNVAGVGTGFVYSDAINVKGGTTTTVTANIAGAANSGTVNGGDIGITGTSATTTVTVNQTAAATAAAAVVAATGAVAVTAIPAASGVNGVAAVTAVTPAVAKAAVAGVIDGKVTVADSVTATLGTIKTVALSNFGAGSSITSNALTDLTLKGTAGTLAVTRVAALASDTLNLTVDGLTAATENGADNTITDTNNEIKTLNVTTGATKSTITAITDTALTTLNVSGASALTLTTAPSVAGNTNLATITVSGAAGLSADVSGLGATLKSFTTTSSGIITATLDAATQTFVGSTGQDVITISADAKKAITGGSGATDVLVLNNTAATFNTAANVAAGTGLNKNVTGFEVLGTGAASQGTFDLSTLPTGLKSIEMFGANAGVTAFTKVTAGSALAIDVAQANAVTYQVADANGTADALTLTLGNAATKAGFTVADLTLKDANDVGLGTLNVVSNSSGFNTGHTIAALTDNGLSTLNVSGNAGLTITALNQATTQATGFTINNTETGAAGVTIGTLTDANLGSLTFTGKGVSEVTHIAGLAGKVITLANTGTGTATVGDLSTAAGGHTGENLQTITLTGNVALGANSVAAAPTAIGATTGVTVNGATDNAHVNISLNAAAAGATNSTTLGNGNDYVTDLTSAGTANVTVGTGYNLINVSTGANNATYAANVTLGAHTNTTALFDKVLVSDTGTQATGISATITGTSTGDVIVFKDATDVTFTALTAAQQNIITADATLTAAIAHAFGFAGYALGATVSVATAFQFGGNTYVIDNDVAGGVAAADAVFTAGSDSVIKIVGLHTVADFGTAVGSVVIAS